MKRTDELIKGNRRITITETSEALDIGRGSADTLISKLGYSKICPKWVLRQLADTIKLQRVEASNELLQFYTSNKKIAKDHHWG